MPLPRSNLFAWGFFLILLLIYFDLGWSARERLLQGNSDFIIYYTAIQMVKDGKGSEIYNLDTARQYQQRILDTVQAPLKLDAPFRAGLLYFVNPPVALMWFLPLNSLGYLQALLLWDLLSVACFVGGILVLVSSRRAKEIGFLTVAVFAFPPVFVTLLQGQTSGLLFLATALVYQSLKCRREIMAGVWLSLLLTKFQLLLPFLILFLWRRQWRVLAGFVIGSGSAFLISLRWVGMAGIRKYVALVMEMSHWVNQMGMTPRSMHCLRGQFNAWWYDSHPHLALVMTIGCTAGFMVLLVRHWHLRANDNLESCYSLLVIVSVLVSPHLYVHDLSLLLVPGLLLFRRRTYSVSQNNSTRQTSPSRESWSVRASISSLMGQHRNIMLFIIGYPLLWASMIVSGVIPLQLSVWAMVLLCVGLTLRSSFRELSHPLQEA